MVFSSQDVAPGTEPFRWFDRRAIVVLDKDELDPHALRLAYLWARWVATRDASAAYDGVDVDRLLAVIEGATRRLKTASAVRGSHTQAKKAIDQAGRQLDSLLADVQSALDELESALRAIRLGRVTKRLRFGPKLQRWSPLDRDAMTGEHQGRVRGRLLHTQSPLSLSEHDFCNDRCVIAESRPSSWQLQDIRQVVNALRNKVGCQIDEVVAPL